MGKREREIKKEGLKRQRQMEKKRYKKGWGENEAEKVYEKDANEQMNGE